MPMTPERPSDEILKKVRRNFYYKKGKLYSFYTGKPVTAINGEGYLYVAIKIGGKPKNLRAHHIVWYLNYRKWPEKEIDHEDRNKTNNWIKNLREANRAISKLNSRKDSMLPPGVYFNKKHECYYVRIRHNGKRLWLGKYDDLGAAEDAYNKKYKEIYGGEIPSVVPRNIRTELDVDFGRLFD